jgi:hypothetical protein
LASKVHLWIWILLGNFYLILRTFTIGNLLWGISGKYSLIQSREQASTSYFYEWLWYRYQHPSDWFSHFFISNKIPMPFPLRPAKHISSPWPFILLKSWVSAVFNNQKI